MPYAKMADKIVNVRQWRSANPDKVQKYTDRWWADKRAYLDSKKTAPCMDCGGTFPPECMEFDHVRGVKRRAVARMMSYSRAVLDAEIAKCELVCANCHRIRTKQRRAQHVA